MCCWPAPVGTCFKNGRIVSVIGDSSRTVSRPMMDATGGLTYIGATQDVVRIRPTLPCPPFRVALRATAVLRADFLREDLTAWSVLAARPVSQRSRLYQFAKLVADDLARSGPRNLGDQPNDVRHLVGREVLAAMGE
jgi:hypothetical protein